MGELLWNGEDVFVALRHALVTVLAMEMIRGRRLTLWRTEVRMYEERHGKCG